MAQKAVARKQNGARKVRRETAYSRSMTTVRVSFFVKKFICDQAKWSESIEDTLRRLFKLPALTPEETKK